MFRDLRNLPDAVTERLGANPHPGVDLVTTLTSHQGVQLRMEERRRPIEIRQTEDGAPTIQGYASVTGEWYDVFGGPPFGWREQIAPGAFQRAIDRGDDTRLLINHTGLPLARTRSGTLTLAEDQIGLRVSTPQGLDMASPRVQELVSAMQRGSEMNRDVDEMSFAFTVDLDDDGFRMEDWNEDFTERIIRGVRLFDVSVVTYPANPATGVWLNSDEPATDSRGMPLDLAKALVEAARL